MIPIITPDLDVGPSYSHYIRVNSPKIFFTFTSNRPSTPNNLLEHFIRQVHHTPRLTFCEISDSVQGCALRNQLTKLCRMSLLSRLPLSNNNRIKTMGLKVKSKTPQVYVRSMIYLIWTQSRPFTNTFTTSKSIHLLYTFKHASSLEKKVK